FLNYERDEGKDSNETVKKSMKFSKLPRYLCLSLARFFYKKEDAISAKILKTVEFPFELDLYEHCHTDLQEKIIPFRRQINDIRNNPDKKYDISKGINEGESNSATYELKSIITHKGRSNDVGHYIAWVQPPNQRNLGPKATWFKMDDIDVSKVESKQISSLKGGADADIAYVLFYESREYCMPKQNQV
ncbi:MAG: Ubiquitin carboxyl-terminal hydrolase 14, partial [Paramarteilia canceri]